MFPCVRAIKPESYYLPLPFLSIHLYLNCARCRFSSVEFDKNKGVGNKLVPFLNILKIMLKKIYVVGSGR